MNWIFVLVVFGAKCQENSGSNEAGLETFADLITKFQDNYSDLSIRGTTSGLANSQFAPSSKFQVRIA